ncbi:MAG TPA: VWA domain-containing protein [Vicinamibacterales bacterium]|jgi:VWFA-related protein
MFRIPLVTALALLAVGAQQKQVFRSDVDVIAIDVAVIDGKGTPVPSLGPDDFDVTVSGKPRKVVRAAWMAYGAPAAAPGAAAPAATPGSAATPVDESAMESSNRMFVIAIDQESLEQTGAYAARNAVEGFIDRLRPDDRIGIYTFPARLANFTLTTDHAMLKRSLFNLAGVRQQPINQYHMTIPEIIDIANGDTDAEARVFARECAGGTNCSSSSIRTESNSLATNLELEMTKSIEGLRGLMHGLAEIPGRKILVLVSGGMISSDMHGGRVNAANEIRTLVSDAAAANAALFVLHLDWSYQQTFGKKDDTSGTYFRNGEISKTGLELMAGMLGGDLIRVQGNSGDVAFTRILNETSAYYLLGVEPIPEDRDGKTHPIKVKVKRRNVTVLARSEVTIPLK